MECKAFDGRPERLLLIYTRYLDGRVARTIDGKCYLRMGDRTRELRSEECQELAYQKGEKSFEDEPAVQYDPTVLAQDVVSEFQDQFVRDRKIRSDRSLEDILHSAHLLVGHNGGSWLTNAGVLLLHQEPEALLGGAYVN